MALRAWWRVQLWLTAPWRCKLGWHVTREGYWSAGMGMLTYHCVNCEKGVRKVPLDEEPTQAQRVMEAWEFIEAKLEEEKR